MYAKLAFHGLGFGSPVPSSPEPAPRWMLHWFGEPNSSSDQIVETMSLIWKVSVTVSETMVVLGCTTRSAPEARQFDCHADSVSRRPCLHRYDTTRASRSLEVRTPGATSSDTTSNKNRSACRSRALWNPYLILLLYSERCDRRKFLSSESPQ